MYYLYNSQVYKYLTSQQRYLLCTNEYFNALHHQWEYKGEKYVKGMIPISDFEKEICNMCWHNNEACISYPYKIILVWWRGRVYYALPDMHESYFKINLYEVGKEIDFNTRIYVSDKNIFPVYKIEGDTLKEKRK